MTQTTRFSFLFMVCTTLLSVGCQPQTEVRTYSETVAPPQNNPMAMMGMGANAMVANGATAEKVKSIVKWTLPQTWDSVNAEGMRLASFKPKNHPNVDISIVQLGASAGGVFSNIKRWFGQLELNPSDAEIQKFIDASPQEKIKVGQAQIFDFSGQTQNKSKTTLAAIISLEDATIFIKATGPTTEVIAQKETLIQFAKTMELSK